MQCEWGLAFSLRWGTSFSLSRKYACVLQGYIPLPHHLSYFSTILPSPPTASSVDLAQSSCSIPPATTLLPPPAVPLHSHIHPTTTPATQIP